jgi:hypothetical protein
VVDQDVLNYAGKPVDYMQIPVSQADAAAMTQAMGNFNSTWYNDCFWNCATYVAHVLSAGHIPNVLPYENSPMALWWVQLVGLDGYPYYRTTN